MKINGSLTFDSSNVSEIQNLRLEKVTALPRIAQADIGRLVFNTSTNSIYVGSVLDGNNLSWFQVSSGEAASAIVAEVDKIKATFGLTADGSFDATKFTGSLAAKNSYTNLITTLQNLVDKATTDVSAEVTRALAAETGLSTRIDTENTRALTAETSLGTRIDTAESGLNTRINSETTRATTAEAALGDRLASEIAERTSAVNLQAGNLSTETAARLQADNTLQANLDAETIRAIQAESSIRSEIASAISGITWVAPVNYMVRDPSILTGLNVGNRVLNLTTFAIHRVTAVTNGVPTYDSGKALVDGTAFFFTNSGAAYVYNGTGVVQFASTTPPPVVTETPALSIVADEAIPALSLVYVKSNGRCALASGLTEGKEAIGFTKSTTTAGEVTSIYTSGTIDGLTGLNIGETYYMGTAPGSITDQYPTQAGNVVLVIGTAVSATQILFYLQLPIIL